ncbi:tif11 [Symbiodinium sp. CCMP2592]|nr:tif11 [Symbiodinium sp. CCMP2592]
MLGNGRCDVQCVDGVKRLCHIRGKMRKKVWCNQGDIVLVSLRDFQALVTVGVACSGFSVVPIVVLTGLGSLSG